MEVTKQSTLIKRFRKLPNELVEHIIKFLHYKEYKALSWNFHKIALKAGIYNIYTEKNHHYDQLYRIFKTGVTSHEDLMLMYFMNNDGMSEGDRRVMKTVFGVDFACNSINLIKNKIK